MSAAKPAPDRRAILGGSLALASAVAATAAPAALAAPVDHPDAELLRLALAITAARLRMDDLSKQSYDLEEAAYREPPMPEALFWHSGDHENVGLLTGDMERRGEGERKRYSYTDPGTLDRLRANLAKWEANVPSGSCYGRSRITRLRELIAAGEAWEVARDAAYEAAGCAALDRAYLEENEHVNTLALQIAALPARTAEGVCAKVRAITAVDCWSVEAIEDGGLARSIAEAETRDDQQGHALLMSVILDVGTLTAPVAANEAA